MMIIDTIPEGASSGDTCKARCRDRPAWRSSRHRRRKGMAAFRPCAASLRLSLSAIKLDANPDRDEDGKAVLNPGTKLDRYSRVSEREAEGGRGSTNAG